MRSPLPEEQGPTFDPKTHFCERHLEPFRETWGGIDWLKAMLGIFQVCVRRKDIQDAAGARIEMLDRVLREYAPLCCLVGDDETAKWTRLAFGPADEYRAAIEELKRGD